MTAIIRKTKLPIGAAIVTMICTVVVLEDARGQSPMGQNLAYYEAMPNYTPHGIQIPGMLVQQASQAHWQQVSHQATINEASLQPIATDSSDGYYGGNAMSDIDPRLMTVQRYDHHWVHLKADYVHLQKREDSNDAFVIGNFGVTGIPPLPDFPVLDALQTNLDEPQSGVRVSAVTNLFYSFDLEAAYFGQFQWGGAATFSTVGMSTFLDDFGTGAYAELGVAYRSQLDSFEVNTRWRWVHTTKPLTGAFIIGARYFRLDERFTFSAVGDAGVPPFSGDLDYTTEAENDLVGFQIGVEVLSSILSKVMVGGDLKAGVYGNRVTNDSVLRVASPIGSPRITLPLGETTDEQIAFVAEANLMGVVELGHGLYLRGGYTGLYIDGVTLGQNAFRDQALASVMFAPQPKPTATDNLFIHGFFGGLEWMY